VRPAEKRPLVEHAMSAHGWSARRACKVMGLERSSWNYKSRPDRNVELRARTRELAARYPRYGQPMIHQLLRREGWGANHKRTERIYREEKLSLRLKHRKKRVRHLREATPVPDRPDQAWSMDFIHDQLVNRRWFKALTVLDHCTRESPVIEVDHSLPGDRAVATLERMRIIGRKPKVLLLDNGPEFTGRALARWASLHDVRLFFIEPGKPTQHGHIESFNGRLRAECLNPNWFGSIQEARMIIESWLKQYNCERPHSSLNGRTPKEVADHFTQMLVNKPQLVPLRSEVVQ
jgi:putative transposase